MNVRDDLSGILKVKEDNVIDSFLHVGHALAANRNRIRVAEPILDDADIVGSEVPEGVDVRTNAPKVQALAVDIAENAQVAGIDQSLHMKDGWVINECMISHYKQLL